MSYVICEQERRRSACASAQSDQRLCCSLLRYYNISRFYSRNFKTLAGLCSWAGQFVSCLVGDSRRHIFSWRGSFVLFYFLVIFSFFFFFFFFFQYRWSLSILFFVEIAFIVLIFVVVYVPDVTKSLQIYPEDALKDAIIKYRDDDDTQDFIDGVQQEVSLNTFYCFFNNAVGLQVLSTLVTAHSLQHIYSSNKQ